jgi:hypothetical protein
MGNCRRQEIDRAGAGCAVAEIGAAAPAEAGRLRQRRAGEDDLVPVGALAHQAELVATEQHDIVPLGVAQRELAAGDRPGRGPGEITAAAGVGDGEVLIGRICLEVDRAAVGLAGRGLLRPPRAGEGDDELRHRRRRGLPHGGRGGRTDEFDRLAFGGLAAKMGLVPPERHNQRIAGAVERELLASDGPARGGGERTTAIVGLDGVTVGERRRVEVEPARLAARGRPRRNCPAARHRLLEILHRLRVRRAGEQRRRADRRGQPRRKPALPHECPARCAPSCAVRLAVLLLPS